MEKYCGYCGTYLLKNAGQKIEQDIVDAFQSAIDGNPWLKGQITAKASDIIVGKNYSLLFSKSAKDHIVERHKSKSKPGSTLKAGLDIKKVAETLLNKRPNEVNADMVKWVGINSGSEIGAMGIAYADPDDVAEMEDYQMPDGAREMVKIKKGKRKPTSQISMITSRAGKLSNGTEGLILVTMFPGGMDVDGHEIPINRNDFAKKGLYFVIE